MTAFTAMQSKGSNKDITNSNSNILCKVVSTIAKKFCMILSLLLYFLAPTSASAASLELGFWNATGSQAWRTAFPLHTNNIDGSSALYYPSSGRYITAAYEAPLNKNSTLRIEGAVLGSMIKQIGSDSDWDYSVSNSLWYYGTFDTTGKSYSVDVSLQHPITNNAKFTYGYKYDFHDYHMTNGLYRIENYGATTDPLPSLDSHYTMIYDGPYVGLQYQYPLSTKVHVSTAMSYTPLAFAQGHGWWNLRNLSFEHLGPAQMFSSKIGLACRLSPITTLSAGYRFQYSSVFTGWEDNNSNITLVKSRNIQKGVYFSGQIQF